MKNNLEKSKFLLITIVIILLLGILGDSIQHAFRVPETSNVKDVLETSSAWPAIISTILLLAIVPTMILGSLKWYLNLLLGIVVLFIVVAKGHLLLDGWHHMVGEFGGERNQEQPKTPPPTPVGPSSGGKTVPVRKVPSPDPDQLGCTFITGSEMFTPALGHEEVIYRVEKPGKYLIQFQATQKITRPGTGDQFIREQNLESANRTHFETMDADGLMEPDLENPGIWTTWQAMNDKPKSLQPPFPEKAYGAGIVWVGEAPQFIGSGKTLALKKGAELRPDINVFPNQDAYAARTGRLRVRVYRCP